MTVSESVLTETIGTVADTNFKDGIDLFKGKSTSTIKESNIGNVKAFNLSYTGDESRHSTNPPIGRRINDSKHSKSFSALQCSSPDNILHWKRAVGSTIIFRDDTTLETYDNSSIVYERIIQRPRSTSLVDRTKNLPTSSFESLNEYSTNALNTIRGTKNLLHHERLLNHIPNRKSFPSPNQSNNDLKLYFFAPHTNTEARGNHHTDHSCSFHKSKHDPDRPYSTGSLLSQGLNPPNLKLTDQSYIFVDEPGYSLDQSSHPVLTEPILKDPPFGHIPVNTESKGTGGFLFSQFLPCSSAQLVSKSYPETPSESTSSEIENPTLMPNAKMEHHSVPISGRKILNNEDGTFRNTQKTFSPAANDIYEIKHTTGTSLFGPGGSMPFGPAAIVFNKKYEEKRYTSAAESTCSPLKEIKTPLEDPQVTIFHPRRCSLFGLPDYWAHESNIENRHGEATVNSNMKSVSKPDCNSPNFVNSLEILNAEPALAEVDKLFGPVNPPQSDHETESALSSRLPRRHSVADVLSKIDESFSFVTMDDNYDELNSNFEENNSEPIDTSNRQKQIPPFKKLQTEPIRTSMFHSFYSTPNPVTSPFSVLSSGASSLSSGNITPLPRPIQNMGNSGALSLRIPNTSNAYGVLPKSSFSSVSQLNNFNFLSSSSALSPEAEVFNYHGNLMKTGRHDINFYTDASLNSIPIAISPNINKKNCESGSSNTLSGSLNSIYTGNISSLSKSPPNQSIFMKNNPNQRNHLTHSILNQGPSHGSEYSSNLNSSSSLMDGLKLSESNSPTETSRSHLSRPKEYVSTLANVDYSFSVTDYRGTLFAIEFKAGRTEIFYVPEVSDPKTGLMKPMIEVALDDLVIVEADRGEDLGRVTIEVPISKLREMMPDSQHSKGKAPPPKSGDVEKDGDILNPELAALLHSKEIIPKRIHRLALATDFKMLDAKEQEEAIAMVRCQGRIRQKKLPMEVVDAEYQWDRNKLTFYFCADRRIDFRELVRDLFRIYKTRIWMCAVDKGSTRVLMYTSANGMVNSSNVLAIASPTLNSAAFSGPDDDMASQDQ